VPIYRAQTPDYRPSRAFSDISLHVFHLTISLFNSMAIRMRDKYL
jgi:hypothetical protein